MSGLTINDQSSTRWLMLALMFVARTGLGFQFQAMGSVSSPLVSEFGFNFTQIGTLIGLFMLPGLFIALPAGFAGRYASDRTLAAMGVLALGVGGVLAAFAQGFGLLALGRIAAGVGFVFSTLYITKMVADWFTGKELATAMAVQVMGWPFGIAMGQLGHVWIAEHYGWRTAFAIAGVYCLLAAAALFALYRSPRSDMQAPAPQRLGLPRSELILTLIAAATWGFFNAAYITYLSFAPRLLIAGGMSSARAAAVASIASWLLIITGTLCGQIVDRTGKRDLVLHVCMGIAIASLLLLPLTSWAIVLCVLLGLAGFAPAGVIMAMTAEAMSPQRRAFGMGLFLTIYYGLLSIVPPIAGWLFDFSGSPYGPIVLAALMCVATSLSCLAFRIAKRTLTIEPSDAARAQSG